MTDTELQEVKKLAASAAFYRCAQGTWRIEYSADEDVFDCCDEDSGEVYQVPFIAVDVLNDRFLTLEEQSVQGKSLAEQVEELTAKCKLQAGKLLLMTDERDKMQLELGDLRALRALRAGSSCSIKAVQVEQVASQKRFDTWLEEVTKHPGSGMPKPSQIWRASREQALLDAMNATTAFGKTGEVIAVTIRSLK
jgi:hypothetical protein